MDAENIDQQVEDAVAKAQKLDGFKQGVLAEMRRRGEDVGDGRVVVAHDLNGRLQIDDLK